MLPNLESILKGSPYISYTYAYPHKTAYRPIKPVLLEQVWNAQPQETFLYVHIPFCEMRCGFCNLFTTVNPDLSLETGFLNALERQARVVRHALPNKTVARAALGGGTPTFLVPSELERVLKVIGSFGIDHQTPLSIETSPQTATSDRLELLASFGVDRISIGVQSFVEAEARAVGRSQRSNEVLGALERIRAFDFPTLNIDLIYGLPNQTAATWLESLQTALEFTPQELFLYPLYVRRLTGLGNLEKNWDDARLELYRLARDFLLQSGYVQHSMRVFRRSDAPARDGGIDFDAQKDGLIGLGVGARSYTNHLHYSSEYAVGQVGIKEIIADYAMRSESDFSFAGHGFYLNIFEQRRRFILQDIFNVMGFSRVDFQQRFASDVVDDFPILSGLLELGLVTISRDKISLTAHGLERSDAIGHLFYSADVQELARAFEWR